jgi:hypothetical protein
MGRTCPAPGQAFLKEDHVMLYLITSAIVGLLRALTGN